MENITTILISAILSGIFATLVTLWWQNKTQVKQQKTQIFTTLMSKRYDISAEESVDALNMIDVIFYGSSKVRQAWKEFNETTKLPESITKDQAIGDKHLRLLELMAEDIGYKNIKWEDIKQYYFPVALANKRQDEAVLRKVQIDAGLTQIKKEEEHKGTAQTNENTMLLMKAMENPDGLLKLLEVAEKAQNFNKNGKNRK